MSETQNQFVKEFAKLPNPFALLLRDVKELSVDDINQIQNVLWLAVRFEQHVKALHLSQSVVLALWYPLSRGFFADLLMEVLQSQGSLSDLR